MGRPEPLDSPATAPLVIRPLPDGDRRRRVVLEGELDLLTSPSLASAIQSEFAQTDELLLDLSAVRFIDSSGLQVILLALKDHGSDGKVLLISSSLPFQARRLFEVTGVLSRLPLVDVQ